MTKGTEKVRQREEFGTCQMVMSLTDSENTRDELGL